MIVDLIQTERDIIAIHERAMHNGKGMEWQMLSKYVAIKVLEARIDQENNMVPVSIMDLELAKLRGV